MEEKGRGEKGKGEKGKEENYTCVPILPSLSNGVVDRDGLDQSGEQPEVGARTGSTRWPASASSPASEHFCTVVFISVQWCTFL